MFNINASIGECISEYGRLISNYSMGGILVVCIIMLFNMDDNSNNLILTMLFNSISLILVFYKYGFDIINYLDSAFNQGFINNICFYFVNTLIALFVMSFWVSAKHIIGACKFTMIIMYVALLFNLLFALYISYAINTDLFISLGNIYPMIILGNLAALLSYAYMIILYFIERYCKYSNKKQHLLYK